jgi:hypothetical protein
VTEAWQTPISGHRRAVAEDAATTGPATTGYGG